MSDWSPRPVEIPFQYEGPVYVRPIGRGVVLGGSAGSAQLEELLPEGDHRWRITVEDLDDLRPDNDDPEHDQLDHDQLDHDQLDHDQLDHDQLGSIRLPFEYSGPIFELRHGLELEDPSNRKHSIRLHELIGDAPPTAVRIEVTRIGEKQAGQDEFRYEGRVKIFGEQVILLDNDPGNPSAPWTSLEDELILSVFPVEARIRISGLHRG